MKDLAEHVGTVMWILSGLLVIMGVLIGLIWNDLRDQLREIKADALKFSAWLLENNKEGGIVTREKYFQWCNENRMKCPAFSEVDIISRWKTNMLEKGGVLTKTEHEVLCQNITEKLMCRVDESFNRHREWVGDHLVLIQSNMENRILKELHEVKEQIGKKIHDAKSMENR